MDNKKNMLISIIFTIVWILVFFIAMAFIISLALNEILVFPFSMFAAFFFIAVWIAILHAVSRRYAYDSEPDPLTKLSEDKSLEAHIARMDKPRKGKDMYEVCDNVVKENNKARIITAAVLSFLMLLFVVGEIIDNKVQSIPLIICIILVTVIVIVLAMLVSIHFDYGFTPAFKLKSAIIKQGFDPDEVNNDFMHATYHDLNLGLMAVGNTYVVVYSSQEFRIIVLENIIKADLHSVRVNSYRAGSITRYYIWLHEKDETHSGYRCADKLTAELLLNRFLIENIPTETFPTGVETPKGIW